MKVMSGGYRCQLIRILNTLQIIDRNYGIVMDEV